MFISDNDFCDGHNLNLKVGQGNLKCSVETKSSVERGQIITWTESQLQDCADIALENEQQIYVQTSLMNALCPPENIVIVQDDAYQTTYSTIAQYTWYNRVASPSIHDVDEIGVSTVLSILSTNSLNK